METEPKLDWTGITIDNGQCEHPDCTFCARIWFAWYAARMRQMHVQPKNKPGISFAEAAATSNIPPKEEQ